MATIAAKAERRATVNQRLAGLSDQIAGEFGIEVPPVPRTTRDPDLDQIIELERIAEIFDGILIGSSDVVDAESIDVMHISRPYRADEFLKEFNDLEDLKQIATIAGVDTELVASLDDPILIAEAVGERIYADDFEFAEFGVADDGKIINFAELDNEPGETEQEEGEGTAETGDESDTEPEDLTKIKLDDLKQRAIDAGHDAEEVNKQRSKKDVIAILNGETEQEEGEG